MSDKRAEVSFNDFAEMIAVAAIRPFFPNKTPQLEDRAQFPHVALQSIDLVKNCLRQVISTGRLVLLREMQNPWKGLCMTTECYNLPFAKIKDKYLCESCAKKASNGEPTPDKKVYNGNFEEWWKSGSRQCETIKCIRKGEIAIQGKLLCQECAVRDKKICGFISDPQCWKNPSGDVTEIAGIKYYFCKEHETHFATVDKVLAKCQKCASPSMYYADVAGGKKLCCGSCGEYAEDHHLEINFQKDDSESDFSYHSPKVLTLEPKNDKSENHIG